MALSKAIELPFTRDSVIRVLTHGATPEGSPYSHKQIAEWCDRFWCQYLDVDADPAIEELLPVLTDVETQWKSWTLFTMKNTLRKLSLIVLTLILAITLALLSAYVERIGPEMASYGNLCGPNSSDHCYKPVLKGGFPFPYLFDAPGVSRERVLAFGEDKLRVGAVVANIAVYFAILILVVAAAWRRRTMAWLGAS